MTVRQQAVGEPAAAEAGGGKLVRTTSGGKKVAYITQYEREVAVVDAKAVETPEILLNLNKRKDKTQSSKFLLKLGVELRVRKSGFKSNDKGSGGKKI
jgi:hypothetical protein